MTEADSFLSRHIDHIWLEFDIDPSDPSNGAPGFFFGFNRGSLNGSGPARSSDIEIDKGHWLFRQALDGLIPSLEKGAPQQLARCIRHLPDSAEDLQIGVMFSRGPDRIRLWMDAIPVSELFSYLAALGWTGDFKAFKDAVRPFLDRADSIFLNLDIGDAVYPGIGVEFYMGHLVRLGLDEIQFIDMLHSRGLCTAEERDALFDWPGMSIERFNHIPGEAKLYRSINHIKLTHQPAADVKAKAYLLLDITPIDPMAGTLERGGSPPFRIMPDRH